jgi:hypothetical protein
VARLTRHRTTGSRMSTSMRLGAGTYTVSRHGCGETARPPGRVSRWPRAWSKHGTLPRGTMHDDEYGHGPGGAALGCGGESGERPRDVIKFTDAGPRHGPYWPCF